ncbi:MAG: twin-arginine translocase subunit TatC [Polyangiales bacterium]
MADTQEPAPTVPPHDVPMTVFEHLGELRTRLIRALLGLIPGIAIAWSLREQLLDMLVAPLAKAWLKLGMGEPTLHFANPVDVFVAYLRIAVVVGIILTSPWAAYQAWGFISPGLYSREKAYALPFALASALFFVGGAFFGYIVVFPVGFESLLSMAGMLPSHIVKVAPTIMIDEYLSFATQMLLGFGIVFEVPVVVAFLALAGIVNWKQLLRFGRWWVVMASVLAAVLTPSPDVGSQLMMMTPLVVLYFAAVGVAYFIGPKVPAEGSASDESGGD